jgi:hypothetical protein
MNIPGMPAGAEQWEPLTVAEFFRRLAAGEPRVMRRSCGFLPSPSSPIVWLTPFCHSNPVLSSVGNPPHCLTRIDEVDALIPSQWKEMLAIACHDQIGSCRNGGRKDLIVIKIRHHHPGHTVWFDKLDNLDVIGKHVEGRSPDEVQAFGDSWPRKHLGQLFQQRRAAAELDAGLLSDGRQQEMRHPAPQQRR